MSVFSVPVTIGVDEERITKEIENNVENRVVENVTNDIRKVMFSKNYYGHEDDEPLRKMVHDRIDKILDGNKDLIIQEAAKQLAIKMARSKAAKEACKDVVDKIKRGE